MLRAAHSKRVPASYCSWLLRMVSAIVLGSTSAKSENK